MAKQDEIVKEYGEPPKFIKYNYRNGTVFGKVVSYYYEGALGCFMLSIEHTKVLGLTSAAKRYQNCKRTWPTAVVLNMRTPIETATEEEYLASLVLES